MKKYRILKKELYDGTIIYTPQVRIYNSPLWLNYMKTILFPFGIIILIMAILMAFTGDFHAFHIYEWVDTVGDFDRIDDAEAMISVLMIMDNEEKELFKWEQNQKKAKSIKKKIVIKIQ